MTEITAGEGFWVNSNAVQTLNVSGLHPTDSSHILTSGWSLIGLKGIQMVLITDLVSGNENSIASIWKWVNNSWAVYLPGEDDDGAAFAGEKGFSIIAKINPGEGFWVNAIDGITLQ